MQMAYTSQNFTLKQCGHIRRWFFSPVALIPEYISCPKTAMGAMGCDDGHSGTRWITEYYYIMLSGYRGVLDRRAFPPSWDLNFVRNGACF